MKYTPVPSRENFALAIATFAADGLDLALLSRAEVDDVEVVLVRRDVPAHQELAVVRRPVERIQRAPSPVTARCGSAPLSGSTMSMS